MNCVRYFLLMSSVLVSVSVHAQTGIYGAFTGAGLGSGSSGNLYGGTVGLYSDPWHGPLLGAGFDLRGEFLNGNGQSLDSGLIGLRIAVHPPVFPLKPYVEGLGGVGRANVANATSTNAQYRIVGGIDWTVFPRIDWRVVEFSGGEISGGASPKVISTGLVLRLP